MASANYAFKCSSSSEFVGHSFQHRKGYKVFPALKRALYPDGYTAPYSFFNPGDCIAHPTLPADEGAIIRAIAFLCRITARACIEKGENLFVHLDHKKVYLLSLIMVGEELRDLRSQRPNIHCHVTTKAGRLRIVRLLRTGPERKKNE